MRILVVDDDAAVRDSLARTLRFEGYQVDTAPDGRQALDAVRAGEPDAVILDVSMPVLDGLQACRELRAGGVLVPVLMLTARDSVGDRVAGLDAGADDYLVKPFATEELLARLRALLRRGTDSPVLQFADLSLDTVSRTAVRGGRAIELTARESALLELLLHHPGRVVSRPVALASVWSDGAATTENVVDRYVAYLRRKLGEPPLIQTVRGLGFRLGGA